jgi:AraC-like DNA-binding protein
VHVGRAAGAGGETFVRRVLPDGCVDIVWDGTRLVVAGPDTGPVEVAPRPHGFYVGIRFRPGLAPTVLEVPASELLDLRVEAVDVLGPERAGRLTERLASRTPMSLRMMTIELEDALSAWLPRSAGPDLLVEAAVASLASGATSARPVGSLADTLGVSERQLHRRCRTAVGYGPKTLDRVLRFRRFLALAETAPGRHLGLARLAMEAGYADQPHLNRECGRLAGVTPAVLVGV